MDTNIGALDDDASAVAVDMNGRVIVAGTSNADIAIVRYLPDGSLDGGFGTGGIKIHDIGTDAGRAVALDPLGITVAGKGGASEDFALTRFAQTNGANNLSVTTDILTGDEALALAIRKDGKLVLAGKVRAPNNQLTLALYNSDGTQTCGTPLLPVDAFTAGATGNAGGGQVTLNWLNPSYGRYDETVIRRATAACPCESRGRRRCREPGRRARASGKLRRFGLERNDILLCCIRGRCR